MLNHRIAFELQGCLLCALPPRWLSLSTSASLLQRARRAASGVLAYLHSPCFWFNRETMPSQSPRTRSARRNKRDMVRLRRSAQLVFLLPSFTDAQQSMCSASMSPSISVCQDNACDSAAVEVGDTVTFQVCVENLSFEIPGSAETTPVSGVLQAETEIEIFLACTTGTASHCPPH